MSISTVIERVAERLGMPKSKAGELVRASFGEVAGLLKKGERVDIPEFGRFEVAYREPRTAKNPKTGEAVDVAGKNVVKFKPKPSLKDAV